MGRDLTGLAGYGHEVTEVPVAEILIERPERGAAVAAPLRPKRMSIREYRERYDSTPHTVVVWREESGEPYAVFRCSGAVSAAVIAHDARGEHGGTLGSALVTIYPSSAAPSRETLQRSRVLDGEVVEVRTCAGCGEPCRPNPVGVGPDWTHLTPQTTAAPFHMATVTR